MAKVLVVDDIPKEVAELVRAITERGYEVVTYGCTREGIEQMQQEDFLAGIFDGHLPKEDARAPAYVDKDCGGAFLSKIARRLRPNMRCAIYSYSLCDSDALETANELGIRVFSKGHDGSIEEIIKELRL